MDLGSEALRGFSPDRPSGPGTTDQGRDHNSETRYRPGKDPEVKSRHVTRIIFTHNDS